MKSRNCATRHNASEPATFPMTKPSFSQSLTKDLANKRNKQSLVPVRSQQRGHPKVLTADKNENHWSDKYGSSFFAHSESSIDRVSSPTLSDVGRPPLSSRDPKSTVFSQPEVHGDSVVSKYIDRFRYGQPLSREERQLMSPEFEEERVPLWWMSSSSLPPSSTPTKTSHKDYNRQASSSPARHPLDEDLNSSPCRGDYNINTHILSDTSQSEFEDTEIRHLQERASRLLQRGESILSNGSIPVSSEGLGSSDCSYPVNINKTPVIHTSIKSTATMAGLDSTPVVPLQQYTVTSVMAPPILLEDDILSQWRLRRKMEQASEQCLFGQNSRLCMPTYGNLGPSLHSSPVIAHPYKQQPCIQYTEPLQGTFPVHKEVLGQLPSNSTNLASAVTDTSAARPQSLAHVPAHMHLLCDILPCPTPNSNMFQGHSHKPEETLSKETKVPGNLKQSYMDEPPHRHIPSPALPPYRPTDGDLSKPMEGSSSSSPLEGHCPSRCTEVKVGDPLKPKEKRSLSRSEEGDHQETPRMINETAETEKPQAKQAGESEKVERVIRKQKKSTRCTGCIEHADAPNKTRSAHQKLPKKNKTRADPQHQERRIDSCNQVQRSQVQFQLTSALLCGVGMFLLFLCGSSLGTVKKHVCRCIGRLLKCLFISLYPAMSWHPVEGVPYLLPEDGWDRLFQRSCSQKRVCLFKMQLSHCLQRLRNPHFLLAMYTPHWRSCLSCCERLKIQMRKNLKTTLYFECFAHKENGLRSKSVKWTSCCRISQISKKMPQLDPGTNDNFLKLEFVCHFIDI